MKINNKIRDEIRLYYDKKNRCPRCNSKELAETDLGKLNYEETIIRYGGFKDRKNKTACTNCNWMGYIDELRP